MTVRNLVQDTFQIPGRGTVVSGLLTDGEIRNGDTLRVEGTTADVRISFVDLHSRTTEEGRRVGLELNPEDATAVTAGSTLVSRPET